MKISSFNMKRQNRQFMKFISLLKFPGLQYLYMYAYESVVRDLRVNMQQQGTTKQTGIGGILRWPREIFYLLKKMGRSGDRKQELFCQFICPRKKLVTLCQHVSIRRHIHGTEWEKQFRFPKVCFDSADADHRPSSLSDLTKMQTGLL